MQKYSQRSFKNIEFLRFLLIFAVVGVHIPYLNLNSLPEFSFLVPWTAGWQAVEMFFVISGFFLFYKYDTHMQVLNFAIKKWLRLSPFIIVLTILGYAMTGFDVMQYPLSVNIYNALLLLDWNTHHFGPDATILYVAWFVNVLFFVSVVYFCILKVLPHAYATLVIGIIAFVNFFMYQRQVYIIVPFIYPLVRAFAFIGFGYLICELWKAYQTTHEQGASQSISIIHSLLEMILFTTIIISLYAGSTGIPTPHGLTVPPEQIASLTAVTWFPDLTRLAIGGPSLQIAFIALFWLFLCNEGVISRLLNHQISIVLGSYSYAVFLVHTLIIRFLTDNFDLPHLPLALEHPYLTIVLILSAIFLLAVITHHCIEIPLANLEKRLKDNK